MTEQTDSQDLATALLFLDPDRIKPARHGRMVREAAEGALPALIDIVAAYQASIIRVANAAVLAYRMAWMAGFDETTQAIHAKAVLAALDQKIPDDAEYRAEVVRIKAEELARLPNDGRLDVVKIRAFERLGRYLRVDQDMFVESSHDVLLQAVAGLWGGFETLVGDILRCTLNAYPELARRLFDDPVAARKIQTEKFSARDLLDHGLDFRATFGDVVLRNNDLSDLESIKAVVLALYGRDEELVAAFESPTLRLLSKLRNLVVHRGGVVDSNFVRAVGDRWAVGQVVRLSTADLESFFEASQLASVALASALPRQAHSTSAFSDSSGNARAN